ESDLSVRFTLERDSFSVTQLLWKAPHTSIDAQLSNSSFAKPNWVFRYRGHLDFEDIRSILRKPNSPSGNVDFAGNGHLADGRLAVIGSYSAADISMPYDWFHSSGINSRGISVWVPRHQLLAGQIPVMASLDYHYSMAERDVVLNASHIDTPSSNVQFSGTLAAQTSKLDATFDSQDLVPWDDFINRLR